MSSSPSNEIPWLYRCRFTNWLMAKPWRWHYRVIYQGQRTDARHPRDGHLIFKGQGRLEALWRTLTFPHVHHESEE